MIKFYFYQLPLLFSALICLGMALILWRERSRPGVGPLVVMSLLAAWWSLGYLLELASLDLQAKYFWIKVQYLGIAFLATSWVAFVFESTGSPPLRRLRRLWPLLIVPVLTLVLVWTNGAHHLVHRGFTQFEWLTAQGDRLVFLKPEYGPAFWLILVYSHALLVAGYLRLLVRLQWRQKLLRGQSLGLFFSGLFPWLGNLAYLLDLSPLPGYDLTSIGFTFSALVLAWTFRRFRLSEILPVARAAILQSMRDGVIVLDRQNRILDFNQAATQIGEPPRSLLVGQALAQVCPEMQAALQRMLEEQLTFSEIELKRNGNVRQYELLLSPLDNQVQLVFSAPEGSQAQEPLGRLLTLRDITDRRRSEQALRESELRYRTMFEGSIDAIFLQTLSGRLLDCNTIACRMHGYDKPELLQMTVADLVADEIVGKLADQVSQALEAGSLFFRSVHKRKNGASFPVEISIRVVTLEGEPHEIVYVRDLTQAEQAEKARLASERRFREMLENVHLIAVMLDCQGRITFCNDYLLELTGWTRSELLGKDWFETFLPDQPEVHHMFFDSLAQGAMPVYFVNPILTRQGEQRRIAWNNSLLWDADGNLTGTASLGEDITEREQAGLALARRAQELVALYETVLEINAQKDLSWLLPAIVERAVKLVGAPMGALYLVQTPVAGDEPELELEVAYRLPPGYKGKRLRFGEGLSGRVAQTGEMMALEDYETWDGKAPIFEAAKFHRILAVPLKIGSSDGGAERVLGVINITDDVTCGPFTSDEVQLVTLFANQAALAMHNARLYAAAQAELLERTRVQQVQNALFRISEATLTASDLAELYKLIHAIIQELMPAKNMYIALYDAATNLLSFPYFADEMDAAPPPHAPGNGLTEYVLRTGQPLFAPPEIFEELVRRGEVESVGAPSLDWLGVPLRRQGQLSDTRSPFGVLVVQTYVKTIRLTQPDLEVLIFVSTQVAMAIQRKRAEEALRASEEQYRLLFENAPVGIVSFTPVGEVVDVNPQALVILGSPSAAATRQINVLTFPPLIECGFSQDVSLCLEQGQPCQAETFYTSRWGKSVYVHYFLTPIRNEQGQVGLVQAILEDITERVQAGQALQASRQKIEMQVRQLTMLHDIDLAISAEADASRIVSIVLERLIQLDEVSAVAFLSCCTGSGELELTFQHGLPAELLAEGPLDWSASCAGEALRSAQPKYFSDLAQADLACRMCQRMRPVFRACAALPLLARDQPSGILLVFSRRSIPGPVSSAPQLDLEDPVWQDFLHALAMQTAIALENARLLNRYQQANRELAQAYDTTIEGWSRALEFRDQETKGHTSRVTEMTMALAQALGVQGEDLVHLRRGVLLHDIGKMGVPDSILLKPGDLTEREWEIMRLHPAYGLQLLQPIEFLQPAIDIPYCHHEKWDGSGYPRGLAGTEIPLSARIFAVVDVWDALISTRPYHAAWPRERAMVYIRDQAGKHFDPDIVDAFLKLIQDKSHEWG